jgi:hypothetical protein
MSMASSTESIHYGKRSLTLESQLLSFPDVILFYTLSYLSPGEWSCFGSVCAPFARQHNELWADLYNWKFVTASDRICRGNKMMKQLGKTLIKPRTTRSESNPRRAFFNALRNRLFAFDYSASRMYACLRKSDSPKTIASMLLPDFPVNRLFVSCSDSTILCAAVRLRRWRVVNYLVSVLGADLNIQDRNGMNALLITAWWGDYVGMKKLFKISYSIRNSYKNRTDRCNIQQSIVDTEFQSDSATVVSKDKGLSSPVSWMCHNDSLNRPASYDEQSTQAMSHVINLDIVGCPSMTSVCGGSGPYTAQEWASRKSVVCPENRNYQDIVRFLKSERKKVELFQIDEMEPFDVTGPALECLN